MNSLNLYLCGLIWVPLHIQRKHLNSKKMKKKITINPMLPSEKNINENKAHTHRTNDAISSNAVKSNY